MTDLPKKWVNNHGCLAVCVKCSMYVCIVDPLCILQAFMCLHIIACYVFFTIAKTLKLSDGKSLAYLTF